MPPVRLSSSALPHRLLAQPRPAAPPMDIARRPMVLERQQGARQLSLFGPLLGGR